MNGVNERCLPLWTLYKKQGNIEATEMNFMFPSLPKIKTVALVPVVLQLFFSLAFARWGFAGCIKPTDLTCIENSSASCLNVATPQGTFDFTQHSVWQGLLVPQYGIPIPDDAAALAYMKNSPPSGSYHDAAQGCTLSGTPGAVTYTNSPTNTTYVIMYAKKVGSVLYLYTMLGHHKVSDDPCFNCPNPEAEATFFANCPSGIGSYDCATKTGKCTATPCSKTTDADADGFSQCEDCDDGDNTKTTQCINTDKADQQQGSGDPCPKDQGDQGK